MKKNIIVVVGLVGLLMISGCSKENNNTSEDISTDTREQVIQTSTEENNTSDADLGSESASSEEINIDLTQLNKTIGLLESDLTILGRYVNDSVEDDYVHMEGTVDAIHTYMNEHKEEISSNQKVYDEAKELVNYGVDEFRTYSELVNYDFTIQKID